ncbi:MAG: hypothetical protein ABFR82_06065 [Nitrospirota bacterium]
MKTGDGAYMISGGFNGGDTVREVSEELMELGEALIGKEEVSFIYKNTINYLLNRNPDISESMLEDYPEFKEWTERILFMIDKDAEYGGLISVIIGQQIMYNLQIMLIGLEIDKIYKPY